MVLILVSWTWPSCLGNTPQRPLCPKAAFTRQTKIGKLVLANSSWCVWTAQKQLANTFCLAPTVCQRVCRLFLHRSHTPTWVCQHEFANFSLPCEGCFRQSGDMTSIISSIFLKFGFASFYFWRRFSNRSHSLIHHFQKCEIIFRDYLYFFELNVTSSTDSVAETLPIWPWGNKLGVSEVASLGLAATNT